MRENTTGSRDHWPLSYAIVLATTLVFVGFLAKLISETKKRSGRGGSGGEYKLPPGSTGWPLVGDTFAWFGAVASSHPPRFVEQQVKRYACAHFLSPKDRWYRLIRFTLNILCHQSSFFFRQAKSFRIELLLLCYWINTWAYIMVTAFISMFNAISLDIL